MCPLAWPHVPGLHCTALHALRVALLACAIPHPPLLCPPLPFSLFPRQLHEEMQATMYQLNAIRSELQGGISLFQPG